MIKRQVLTVESLVGLSFCPYRLLTMTGGMAYELQSRSVQITDIWGILEEILRKPSLNRNPGV